MTQTPHDSPHFSAADVSTALLEWLRAARQRGASDLHLVPGAHPCIRVRDDLLHLDHAPVLDGGAIAEMAKSLLHGVASWDDFAFGRRELDWGLELNGLGRLRMNLSMSRGHASLAIRLVPRVVPAITDLQLPRVTASLIHRRKGLWIITGPTGSGKSTTQAAIVHALLEQRHAKIVTVEDPIEYVHPHAGGLVLQREIGSDTNSFEDGVKFALRQNVDVIQLGEMRDLETIRHAIRAAETGHLVLSTLHTVDAAQTVDRIVDVFPADQQAQIRVQLSDVLLAIYAQQLIPTAEAPHPTLPIEFNGRVVAVEVLLGAMADLNAARAVVRDSRPGAIYTLMEQNVEAGCRTMEWALVELVRTGKITERTARAAALRQEAFAKLLQAKTA